MKLLNQVNPNSLKGNSWLDYWSQDKVWSRSAIWEVNARLLLKYGGPLLNLSRQDQVLDIGCGAGHAAALLAPYVGSYLGVDPSQELLRLAEKRCGDFDRCTFEVLPAKEPEFSRFGKFSIFICASVIQYFSGIEEVLRMVESAQRAALPGARMLIADIPQPAHFSRRLKDHFDSWIQSIREGYMISYLKTCRELLFSDYRKFSKNKPVLEIPVMELKRRISELGFETILLEKSVSVCSGRPSLLILF